jgi:hypothetical protein
MQTTHKINSAHLCLRLIIPLLLASICSVAQSKPEVFQAEAFGQGTQLGRTYNVTISIDSYSTPEDQQTLLAAFNQNGNEGLVKALEKLPSKGRIAITGSLGSEVTYVRVFPTETGRKIRLITNRPLAIGEVRNNTRSSEYNLSALELDLSNEKGKSTGTLLPACQFKVNEQKEIEIEAFQNPWRLVNIIDRTSPQ